MTPPTGKTAFTTWSLLHAALMLTDTGGILETLARHHDKLVAQRELLQQVWDGGYKARRTVCAWTWRDFAASSSRTLRTCGRSSPKRRLVPAPLAHGVADSPWLELTVDDGSGSFVAIFFGRRSIPGLQPGRLARFEGVLGEERGRKVMLNPLYGLLLDSHR